MKALTVLKYALPVAIVLLIVGFLHYNLPRTEVVQITGTDTKRVEGSERGSRGSDQAGAGLRMRDVRFINVVDRDGEIRVFRNEDTGWAWPPYFKFDSADMTAQAQAHTVEEPRPWVRVRYYGWRLRMFSMFPNAVSLKVVDKGYSHLPLFNIVFLVLLCGAIGFVAFKLRGVMSRVKARFSKGGPPPARTDTD